VPSSFDANVNFLTALPRFFWQRLFLESGVFENQDTLIVQLDFGRLPRRALIEAVRSGFVGLRGRWNQSRFGSSSGFHFGWLRRGHKIARRKTQDEEGFARFFGIDAQRAPLQFRMGGRILIASSYRKFPGK